MGHRERTTLRGAILLLVMLSSLPPARAEMYRWVDERGQVHYSDIKPSEAIEQSVLDKQGRVLRKLPRPGVASETAADDRVRVRDTTRERLDRALLSTYVHEGEIDLARDRALAHEKARQTSLEAMRHEALARLARLDAESADHVKAGRRVPDALRQSRSQVEQEIERLNEMLRRSATAMAQIEARYAAHKLRFRELKGLASESHSTKTTASTVGNHNP